MKLLKPAWVNHDGDPIFSVDINPDNVHFATGGQGKDNTGRVVIWNLKAVLDDGDSSQPKLLCQLDHHSACVNSVRWSNSGRFLASAGDDRVIIIWRLAKGVDLNAITINHNSINSAFGPTNLEVWKTVCMLRGHDGDVLDLAWSPEDQYLASCSIDNCVKIWDAQSLPNLITTLEGHTSMVKGVTWDPVGKYLASQSVDKTVRIWRTSDWATDEIIEEPFVECGGTTHVLRLAWSPDGLYLVSAHALNTNFPTAQIIERDGWKVDKDFVGHRKAVVCVKFNPHIVADSKTLIKHCVVAMGSRDRSISVWSTALRRPVVVVKDAFSHSVLDLSWSHCGRVLMACSWDGTVIAVSFDVGEIGAPLNQEQKDAFFHKSYGSTNLIRKNNNNNIVPNMEVYLARVKKEEKEKEKQKQSLKVKEEKEEKEKNPEQNLEPLPPPLPLPSTPPIPSNSNNNSSEAKTSPVITPTTPTKQIETRTAQGVRRITPISLSTPILPLPNQRDTSGSPNREENKGAPTSDLAEGTTPIATPSAFLQNNSSCGDGGEEGNLRENMVSSIEEVQQAVSLSNNNHKEPGKDMVKDKEIPMEVDEEEEGEGKKKVANGVSSTILTNGNVEGEKLTNGDTLTPPPSQPSSVNSIPVKKKENSSKRPIDEVKTPQISAITKKKFAPQCVLKMIKDGSSTPTTTMATAKDTPPTHTPKGETISPTKGKGGNMGGGGSSKTKLTPMKIEGIHAIRIHVKLDLSYSLQVSNAFKRSDGVVNQLECQHTPSSMNGLDWVVCTDAGICGVSGDMHRIVAVCEDATVHVFDVKGRYAMSPFLCSSYPSRMVHNGPLLMVITVKGILHLWNIHTKTVVIKNESLIPVLNQPGDQQGLSPDKPVVDISNAYLSSGGAPVIYLTNGKSFMYNKEMCTWSLLSDTKGLVSSPLMADAATLSQDVNAIRLGRRKKPEPAIITHIKLQLIRAIEMKRATSIAQWVTVLGKTLASHGLEKELKILCEDLLGPTHSSGGSSTWVPKLADCVDKRTLLRDILNSLLEDLRWQDLFCEFDDLLKHVEESTSSSSSAALTNHH